MAEFINKYFSYLRGKSIENPNLTKSLTLHFIIFVLISGLLPVTCSRKIEKPQIISVDILPMGDEQKKETTVKKEEPKPKPKEVKKPDEATKMEKAEKPKPVAKPEEKKPAPKKVEKKPEPEKKKQEQQKKDEKDQEGKKKLLKDLEKKEQQKLDDIFANAAKEDLETQTSNKSTVADPAFVNELMGKIQSQVTENWNIPIGVKDVQNIQVRLFIALTPQGVVTDVRIMDQLQYSTDNKYRVVADSAVWAVKEASPFQGLPADKYDLWREIEFTFDPSKAL